MNAQNAPEASVTQSKEQTVIVSQNKATDVSLTPTSSSTTSSPEPVIDLAIQKIHNELADIRSEQQIIAEKSAAIAAIPFNYAAHVAFLTRLIKKLDSLLVQVATLPGAQIPQPDVFGKLTLEQELRKEKAIIIAKQIELSEKFREAIKKYTKKEKSLTAQ